MNLAGLAINRNYAESIRELEKALGLKLEKEGDFTFDDAWSNNKNEDIFDIYFSPAGTLIIMDTEWASNQWEVENQQSLTFIIETVSMTFNFIYCEGKEEKRNIVELNGERLMDSGSRLPVEEDNKDIENMIYAQISKIIEEDCMSIEPDAKIIRYKLIKEEASQNQEKPAAEQTEAPRPEKVPHIPPKTSGKTDAYYQRAKKIDTEPHLSSKILPLVFFVLLWIIPFAVLTPPFSNGLFFFLFFSGFVFIPVFYLWFMYSAFPKIMDKYFVPAVIFLIFLVTLYGFLLIIR